MNIKIVITFLLAVASTGLFAQFNIKIIVKAPGLKHLQDSIHIAGNFNGWNPASKQSFVLNNSGEADIVLRLDKGHYEYKFTRGSWDKGETNSSGAGIANRQLTITSDTSFDITIGG